MKYIFFITIFIIYSVSGKPLILTSNKSIQLIVNELTGANAETDIIMILPEQKTSMKSSDVFRLNAAGAFVYLSDSTEPQVLDLPVENKIQLFDYLDESLRLQNTYGSTYDLFIDSLTYNIEDSAELDSTRNYYYSDSVYNKYFYLDPISVSSILPELSKTLGEIFPENRENIKRNAERFAKRLDLLNKQIAQELEKVRGMPVYSDFSFLNYFCKRYNLNYAASFSTKYNFGEKYTKFVFRDMKNFGIRALFVAYPFQKSDSEYSYIIELDIYGQEKNYQNYSEFMIDLTRKIKNALLFY